MLLTCSIIKKKIIYKYDYNLRSLFMLIRTAIPWHYFFFIVQQFKAGHLSIAYEIPTRHKRKLQHPTKTHCV